MKKKIMPLIMAAVMIFGAVSAMAQDNMELVEATGGQFFVNTETGEKTPAILSDAEYKDLTDNFNKSLLNGNIQDGRKLVLKLEEYKSMIETSAKTRQVYTICRYVQELASEFHSFYNAVRVISDDKELTKARLALVYAVKTVLNNALDLLAVTAPERM